MARERTELRTNFTKRAESDPPVFLPMQSLCSFVGCGAGVSPPHCLNNRGAKPIRVAELIASDSEVAYFSCAYEKSFSRHEPLLGDALAGRSRAAHHLYLRPNPGKAARRLGGALRRAGRR